MIAGVLAVIGALVALIAVHEAGHMLAAKALGVRVTDYSIGFGPALVKKQLGETTYAIRPLLLGGYAKMAGMNPADRTDDGRLDEGRPGDGEADPRSYNSKPPWRRAAIIFAGPAANLLATVVILTALYMNGVTTGAKPVVGEVGPDTLAASEGLRPGDRFVAVDGERIGSWEEVSASLQAKEPGSRIELTLDRGGESYEAGGTLSAAKDGGGRAQLGVSPEPVRQSYGPLQAASKSVEQTVEITRALGVFAYELLTGEEGFYENVSGPIGVASAGDELMEQDVFVPAMALVSLNLALANLLPVLPLDGGHLLMIGAEKLRGRPLSIQTMTKITFVGLALVLFVFVSVGYVDVSKIISGEPIIGGP